MNKMNFSTGMALEMALDLLQVHGIDVSGGKMDIVRHDELLSKISADCLTSGVRVTGVDSSVDGNVVTLTFEAQARALKTIGIGTVLLSTRATLSYSADRIKNLGSTAWESRKTLFVSKLIEALKTGAGFDLPDEGGISARILQETEEILPAKVAEAIAKTEDAIATGALGVSKLNAGIGPMNLIEKFLSAQRKKPVSLTRQILGDPPRTKDNDSTSVLKRSLTADDFRLQTDGRTGVVPSKLVFDNTDGSGRNSDAMRYDLVNFTGKDGQQFTLTKEALIGLVQSGMLNIRDLQGLPQDLFELLGGEVTKPTEAGIRKLKLDDDKTGS